MSSADFGIRSRTVAVAEAPGGELLAFLGVGNNAVQCLSRNARGDLIVSEQINSLVKRFAVVRAPSGQVAVFAIGVDDNLWLQWRQSSGTWDAPQVIDSGVRDLSVVANADGRLEALMVGTDDNLWTTSETAPGASWSAAQMIDTAVTEVAVARNADGRLEAFTVGQDGNVWHLSQLAPGQGWSPAEILDEGVKHLSVVPNADGRLELLMIGSDDNLWRTSQTASGGAWSAATMIDTGSKDVTGVLDAKGRIGALMLGTDGNVWYRRQSSPGSSSWAPSELIADVTFSGGTLIDLASVRIANGRLVSVFSSASTGLYWSEQAASGSWTRHRRALTSAERDFYPVLWPKMPVREIIATDEPSLSYNCIAWSVGMTNEAPWPGSTLAHFDAFYAEHGLTRSNLPGDVALLGHSENDIRHAAVVIGYGRFESKCGIYARVEHAGPDITGFGYGHFVAGYSYDQPQRPRRTRRGSKSPQLTQKELRVVSGAAARLPKATRFEFAKRFSAWSHAIAHSPRIALSSNPATRREADEFYEVLAMGPEIAPLLMEKLCDPRHFFALQLHEALLESPAKRSTAKAPVAKLLSEQAKAVRAVKRWISTAR